MTGTAGGWRGSSGVGAREDAKHEAHRRPWACGRARCCCPSRQFAQTMSCPGCGYGDRWSGWDEDGDVEECQRCQGNFCVSCAKVPVSLPVSLPASLFLGPRVRCCASQSCRMPGFRSHCHCKDTQSYPYLQEVYVSASLSESLQDWVECERCGESRHCDSCSNDWEACEGCDARGCCLDLEECEVDRPHAECEVPRKPL